MGRPMPTTKAQVSGHKFLRRRVEHGLVMGDIRMIHDPMATRRRALMFGIIAVALVAVGCALLAWLQPNPAPGQAKIVRSSQGQLFALVDETYHPVANLASARIIAGESAQPASIGDSYLTQAQLGAPVGIVDAPGFLAPAAQAEGGSWLACYAAGADQEVFPTQLGGAQEDIGRTVVVAHSTAQAAAKPTAALVRVEDQEWLVNSQGRTALPAADSPEGRVVRRVLGIDTDTFMWALPAEVLNAFAERPAIRFPDPLPTVVDTGRGVKGLRGQTEDGVFPLTETQATMLIDMGAKLDSAEGEEIAAAADARPRFNLPDITPSLVSPERGWVCANADGGLTIAPPADGVVALSGDGVADSFTGLDGGGVGVDTGNGYQVVSATGQRHRVEDPAVLEALGLDGSAAAPWEIIRLLPEGTALTRQEALRVTY